MNTTKAVLLANSSLHVLSAFGLEATACSLLFAGLCLLTIAFDCEAAR